MRSPHTLQTSIRQKQGLIYCKLNLQCLFPSLVVYILIALSGSIQVERYHKTGCSYACHSGTHVNERCPPLRGDAVLPQLRHGIVERIRNRIQRDDVLSEQLLVEVLSYYRPVRVVHRPV
jgi:hypothetical protein